MSKVIYEATTADGVGADVVKGWTSDFQRRSYHVRLGGRVFTTRPNQDDAVEECQRLVAEWDEKHPVHAPADPGDFRFEITALDEPEAGSTHLVVVIGDRGEELERFTTDDPYGAVEAAREVQAIPLEERWDLYAERGW